MSRRVRFWVPVVLALAASHCAVRRHTEVQRPAARVVAGDLSGDSRAIAAARERLDKLRATASASAYRLAQAEALLDFAREGASEPDRSGLTSMAFFHARYVIDRLEAGEEGLPLDLEVLDFGEQVRPDLWLFARVLKSQPGFGCAAASVARLEIALVRAAHWQRRGASTRAALQVALAEALANQAERDVGSCASALELAQR